MPRLYNIIIFFVVCSNGFQPRLSPFLATRLPLSPKTVRKLLDNPADSRESIPERGLKKIDIDTDDIIRESADVMEPNSQSNKKWGFRVKGPKSASGHLLEKDEATWDNLERHHEKWEQKVEVHDIKDIDPVTVTAMLFAALAVNFIIFAHWGGAGLGNLVARVMNDAS